MNHAAARKATILSGTGRYADPWHPFASTTSALAAILSELNFEVAIASDVETGLAELSSEEAWPDLLVVNIGLPRDGGPSPDLTAADVGLAAYARSPRPLWAVHSSATSLTDSAIWSDAVGGRWERGTTFHPDYGPAEVTLTPQASAVLGVDGSFTVFDEMYTRLAVHPAATVLAHHVFQGRAEPLAWLHDRGPGRTIYDALGHDGASYESPQRRAFIHAYLAWLLETGPAV